MWAFPMPLPIRSTAATGTCSPLQGSGRKPTGSSLMESTGLAGTPTQYITPEGASRQLLGVEAIREFNVLTATYSAEYGKRAGGQINVVTTSGTNQLHGTAFEYLRNSVLDARNFFDQTIGAPPFKRNQFGGSLGGPLKKDKMFAFGTYEGYQERLSRSSASVVPGAFARQGLAWPGNSIGPNNSPVPVGSPVPGLKPELLKYANAFWPAPSTPDRPD